MTESELEAARALLKRKQAGWDYLEQERRERLRNLVTKDVMPSFDLAFRATLSLLPRTECGMVEFYKVLMGARK